MGPERYLTRSKNPVHPCGSALWTGHRGGGAWCRSLLYLALALVPCELYGLSIPKPAKLELRDSVSGRHHFDETDVDDDLKILTCSPDGSGASLDIRMTVSSGRFKWRITSDGEVVGVGSLDAKNGWSATRKEIHAGVYTLEVVRQGAEDWEGSFRRRIDFATGMRAKDVESIERAHAALVRHKDRDFTGLMNALDPVDTRATFVPRQMREELAWARIESMIHLRKFEDVLPAIDDYRLDHLESENMDAVRECELAALFERGQKKHLESVRFNDEKSVEREAEGAANLRRFVELARTDVSRGYSVLPKRCMKSDMWTARLILGQEAALRGEVSSGDEGEKEEFALHCALVCPEIHPGRPEQNLKRMEQFLETYPDSSACPRVELDMADVALKQGINLVKNAGESKEANLYFELACDLFSKVSVDEAAGIDATDVADAWDGILQAYYWGRDENGRQDESGLLEWADSMISSYPSGDPAWRQAKLYKGDLLLRQGKYRQAAETLDELVALGFEGNPSHDGRTFYAVAWRIDVAQRMGDHQLADDLKRWVVESDCEDSVKREWVEQIGEEPREAHTVSLPQSGAAEKGGAHLLEIQRRLEAQDSSDGGSQ